VLSTVTSGLSLQHPVTVREGVNMYEIADALVAQGFAAKDRVLALCRDPKFIATLGFTGQLPPTLEGYLSPETYFVNRAMSAEEGLAWGFWNRLSDDVLADAITLARDLAAGPTFAHAVTKRQLDAEWDVSIETALDMEAVAQAECMQTNDFKRAYEAFVAKRTPEFQGD
jgi:hypothetical protein